MSLADDERSALADLLADVGPDRPTLCEGWSTGDLLVHLLVRERRPDGAAGILVPRLAGHLHRISEQFRTMPWADQVGLLRSGPPTWNPMGWGPVKDLANGAEMLIHHEDARRGAPGWEPRGPQPVRDAAAAALVGSALMRMRLRRSPIGLTAIMPGRDPVALHGGSPVVQVHGDPVEVLLWLGGRSATRAELRGDPEAVRVARSLRRTM